LTATLIIVAIVGAIALAAWFAARRRLRVQNVFQPTAPPESVEEQLVSSEERLREALLASGVGTWRWHLPTNEVTWSEQTYRMFGVPPGTKLTHESVLAALHPDDRDQIRATVRRVLADGSAYDVEYRVVWPDGSQHWIAAKGRASLDPAGRPLRIKGVALDITERKRTEALLVGQNRVLQLIATGAPLPEALDALLRLVESLAPSMLTSILLLDTERGCLRHGAAPRLSADFQRFIDGNAIGPNTGSCGTAAFLGERVIATDIETDTRWVDYRAAAAQENLRACWSTPIFGANRAVLGTFAIYYREPKAPEAYHLQIVDMVTQTAALAIEQAHAAESLRRSEADLRAAQERAQLGSWEIDLRTQRRSWSPQMYRLFDRDAALSAPTPDEFLELVHPDDRAQIVSVRAGLTEPIQPMRFEFRSNPERGPVRYYSAIAEHVRDSDGQFRRVVGTVMDITERYQTEALLRLEHTVARCLTEIDDSVEALEQVIRAVCEAGGWECGRYWRVDESAGVLRFAAGWSTPGEQTEQFIARSHDLVFRPGEGLAGVVWQSGVPEWVPDVERDARVKATALSRASGMHGALVFPIIAEGKTLGVFSISSRQVREPDDRLLEAMRVIGSQIGQFVQRRDAQRAVKEWKERYEAIILASGHVLYDWETRTNDVTYAGNLKSTLGYTTAEMAGGLPRWMELVHPEDAPRFNADLERARTSDGRFHHEYRIRHKDGRYIVVGNDGYPIFDRAGSIVRVVGFVRDITERKQAEAERLRLEAELRQSQKMQALGTLAGGIAHDFNNILMAIAGNAKLALADLGPDHPAAASIAEIDKSSARAANLVRQILAFSRQEEAVRGPVQLATVVADALALLRATLPATIEVQTRFAENFPPVLADETQIQQIIMNLGANAAYAMKERGGVLEVVLDAVTVGAAFACARADLGAGRYVRLSVSDTGCGMDQATVERVFEPFFTTKPRGEGVGLGLAVVHGIMQAHDGTITVESAPARGTKFELHFPALYATAIAQSQPAVPQQFARDRTEHILYVDDEEALVYLAERTLKRLGYRVSGYTDPQRALQAFDAHPDDFDAVVTDLSMPGLPGPELVRELLRIRPAVPVVMMSGYVRPEEVEVVKALGVREVILKPNTVEELGKTLDALLRTVTASTSGD
jgi:PAS domain S-box-containing protein